MTIAAAYFTSEGIVLGSDSTTTISVTGGQQGVAQLFNHAQKIFEVGPAGEGRIGVCTWGSGRVGETSHRVLIARLASHVSESGATVREAAEHLRALVSDAMAGSKEIVGYYVGGWDLETHNPDCYQVTFEEDGAQELVRLDLGHARFSGAPEFFTRVFRGFDSRLPRGLLEKLKEKIPGLPDGFDRAYREAFSESVDPLLAAGFTDIPIREAIDFVHAYINITIKAFKFRHGPPLCGGPIEIAFISADRPFRWVCHKDFGSATFEQETAL